MTWPAGRRDEWAVRAAQDPRLLAGVMRRAWDEDRAREAIQEAICRIDRATDAAKQDYGAFVAWLTRVAWNWLADGAERAGRQKVMMNEHDIPEREADDPDRREQLGLLEQAVAELPEPDRSLVLMRLRGCSLAQIAAHAGLSPVSVWRRLREPMRRVRVRLLEWDRDLFGEFHPDDSEPTPS